MAEKTTEEVLEESTAAAKEAAASIGGTFERGVGFTPGEGGADAEPAETTDSILSDIAAQASQDIATSEPGVLEGQVEDIKEFLETGQEARERELESQFARGREDIQEAAAERITSAREASRGLGAASTFSLVKRIEESAEKSIRDLEARKNEAIDSGQFEMADRLGQLQFRAIELKENQKQAAIQNALSIAGLQFGERREARIEQAQGIQQATQLFNTLNSIGLLDRIGPGDRRKFEGLLGLEDGALDDIVPKANEEFLFREVDPEGNVSAVFLDKNTGKMTVRGAGNIGGGGRGIPTSEQVNLDMIEAKDALVETLGDREFFTLEEYKTAIEVFSTQFAGRTRDPITTFLQILPPSTYLSNVDRSRALTEITKLKAGF